MTNQEGIKDFNRTSLNIKKYLVGKEKEELLTLGRSFVDIKYIVNENISQVSNKINNEDNNSISNKSDSNSTNYTKINKDSANFKYNKDRKIRNNIINNNNFDNNFKIVNKNNINKKEKDNQNTKEEVKANLNKEGRQARRSITSHDLERIKEIIKPKDDPYIERKKIPKKKDSSKLIRNNLLMSKGNTNVNSIRDINKIENNKKVYPIIEKDKKTYLSQQFHNNSIKNLESPKNQEDININNENNVPLEIVNCIELNKQKINNIEINEEMKIYDTFCIGVFISGISPPIKSNSIIENSEFFVAPCGHLQCSLFPSLQPQLLHTYINKNMKNFNNLTQLVASMCFPLGIKPCFGCRFDENNKIDNLPNPQQVFFNIIKNEKNENYYIATLQYFIKMSNSDYLMKYKFNPITYYLEKTGNNSNNKDKKFKNNMKMISDSLNNDNVFIPESISLISKYPLFIPMDKCLRCMISLQTEDMNNLINHLINEVPSPKKNYQIQFFIPKIKDPIMLNHEYNKFLNDTNNNNILSTSQINVKILLEKISVENIIMIFQLMLLEQKILFLENNYQTLSEISFTFLELIYPLIWVNPFLPVLSIKTVQFLQSPVPYIMGLDEYLFKYANESKSIYFGTDMIIFNLMTNQFISSKTKKRIHKKEIFHEFRLPTIPDKIGDFIYKELKNIRKIIEKNKKEKLNHDTTSDIELDKQIRMIFLKAMIMLIGDYNNFLFYTEDEIPLFNKEAFVQSHKDKNSQFFLGEMVKTQIFNQFLLNEKQLYIKTKNKLKDISNKMDYLVCQTEQNNKNQINYELIDTSYFKKLISTHHDLLNSEKIRSRAFSSKKQVNSKVKAKLSSSQRKSKFPNKKDDLININKVEKDGVINPMANPLKEDILNDLDNNNIGNGNYSIDYIRGKKKSFHSNVNLSGCFPGKINSNYDNNLEEINKNDKIDKIDKSMHRTKSAKKIFILKSNYNSNANDTNNNEQKLGKNLIFEKIKKYLLYPYFLPRFTKNINFLNIENIQEDIDIYLKKKNFKYQCQDKDHVFIISKRNPYKFDNINQKRIYILPKNKTESLLLNLSKENSNNSGGEKIVDKNESIDNIDINAVKNNNNNSSNSNSNNNNKGNITDIHSSVNSVIKNSEETKLIKECFILCYTNKNRITKEQINKLEKIFMEEENKLFFANLILPDTKINKTKNHKQLTSTSFEDIGKILKASLENLTSNEFNTCRLLTISCFVYYKIENKKLIYLYENYIHGIYPCRLWLSEEFWKNFFKLEFEEEKKNENDLLNLYKYNFNGSINYMIDIEKSLVEKNKEQILYDTSSFMAELMIKLKLSKKLILNTFKKELFEQYEQDNNKIEYLMKHVLDIIDKF